MRNTKDAAGARVGRRRTAVSRVLSGAGLLVAVALGVSACGGAVGGTESKGANNAGTAAVHTATATGKPSGTLTISNWPYYIGPHTISGFEKATGIKTHYIEDYNSNEEFYGKIQPLLAKGESGGRSLIIGPSPFIVERMLRHHYLQKFEKSAIPTVYKNLAPSWAKPSYDPNNEFTVPWLSGMMGMTARTDLAPNLKNACEMFSQKYKGKIEVFNELRQAVGVVMKCMGVTTNTPSEAQWMAAINKLKKAKEDGVIRKFSGNNWTRELLDGNAVATIGDEGTTRIIEKENSHIKWFMPPTGCVIFTNDITIPVGAPNPGAAYAFLNYLYKPTVYAEIIKATDYFTPVKGAKEAVEKIAPELAKDPLVFPEANGLSLKNCSPEPTLSPSIAQKVEAAWAALTTS